MKLNLLQNPMRFKSVQKLEAVKMFLLAISEATVGLSLSIVYHRKALP